MVQPVEPVKTKRRSRVALRDVAEAAGLGTTTVSDILNRNIVGKYPPETRARVFRAMKATGYTPSRAAQKLRGTRSKEVGVVLTREFANPFFARLAHQFQRQLRQLGYRMQLQVTGPDLWSLSRFPMELLGDDVDGVILGPVYESDRNHLDPLQAFADLQKPVVLFGGPCESGFIECLFPHHEAGRLAGQMLFDVGHRRVLFLGGKRDSSGADETSKESGVVAAARACGGTVEFVPHLDTDSYDDFYAVASAFGRRWLRQSQAERVTGVVCRNDQTAMAAVAAWCDLGIKVPDDLSIVGMDNLPEGQILRPGLCTVDFRIEEQVERVVHLMIGALEDSGRQASSQPPPTPRAVWRKSVAPVPPQA